MTRPSPYEGTHVDHWGGPMVPKEVGFLVIFMKHNQLKMEAALPACQDFRL